MSETFLGIWFTQLPFCMHAGILTKISQLAIPVGTKHISHLDIFKQWEKLRVSTCFHSSGSLAPGHLKHHVGLQMQTIIRLLNRQAFHHPQFHFPALAHRYLGMMSVFLLMNGAGTWLPIGAGYVGGDQPSSAQLCLHGEV